MRNRTDSGQGARQTRLVQAVGLALGLVGAAIAQPTPAADRDTVQPSLLGQAVASGQHTAQPQWTQSAIGGHLATASTITASNCNDSGTHSLRWAVGQANDNDIIDLSGLECTINLQSSIVTSVDNLTIQGADSKYTIVSGQDSVRPFEHNGHGTLAFIDLGIEHGLASDDGGCVFSRGSVSLTRSSAKYCTASANTGRVFGGAIRATDDVTLNTSAVMHSQASVGSGGSAAGGGGISSNIGIVRVLDQSLVAFNTATSGGSMGAFGGGISSNGLKVVDSSITQNTVHTSSNGVAAGGGARVRGSSFGVSIVGSYLSDNQASSTGNYARGGGLAAWGVGVTIKDSTLSGNKAVDGSGGAIYMVNGNSLDLSGSTISGNQAAHASAMETRGNVDITRSTISGNTSTRGAVVDLGALATQVVEISQSTIVGNENADVANSFGAGLFLEHDTVVKNSTIAGNVAHGSSATMGAGITLDDGVTLTLSSTIVSGNRVERTSLPPMPSAVGVSPYASSAQMIGAYNVLGLVALAVGDSTMYSHAATDPGLGPLQDNGGPTFTRRPEPGSVAIAWGLDNGFTWDQRGPGYRRVADTWPDAGAVERYGGRIFADGFE